EVVRTRDRNGINEPAVEHVLVILEDVRDLEATVEFPCVLGIRRSGSYQLRPGRLPQPQRVQVRRKPRADDTHTHHCQRSERQCGRNARRFFQRPQFRVRAFWLASMCVDSSLGGNAKSGPRARARAQSARPVAAPPSSTPSPASPPLGPSPAARGTPRSPTREYNQSRACSKCLPAARHIRESHASRIRRQSTIRLLGALLSPPRSVAQG